MVKEQKRLCKRIRTNTRGNTTSNVYIEEGANVAASPQITFTDCIQPCTIARRPTSSAARTRQHYIWLCVQKSGRANDKHRMDKQAFSMLFTHITTLHLMCVRRGRGPTMKLLKPAKFGPTTQVLQQCFLGQKPESARSSSKQAGRQC